MKLKRWPSTISIKVVHCGDNIHTEESISDERRLNKLGAWNFFIQLPINMIAAVVVIVIVVLVVVASIGAVYAGSVAQFAPMNVAVPLVSSDGLDSGKVVLRREGLKLRVRADVTLPEPVVPGDMYVAWLTGPGSAVKNLGRFTRDQSNRYSIDVALPGLMRGFNRVGVSLETRANVKEPSGSFVVEMSREDVMSKLKGLIGL